VQDLSLKKYSKEELSEMSLLEIAHELLVEKNQPILFKDLVKEAASLQGLEKSKVESKISQFYTDLNVDGLFTSLGENRWGLKTWYPVDQIEDEVVHAVVKPKKKKAKKAAIVDEDLEDLHDDDDEDEIFEEDLDILDDDDDDDIEDEDLLDVDLDSDIIDDDDEDIEEDLDEELIEDEEEEEKE
jgi:DNA-directed RNA polymerase subunit delta